MGHFGGRHGGDNSDVVGPLTPLVRPYVKDVNCSSFLPCENERANWFLWCNHV